MWGRITQGAWSTRTTGPHLVFTFMSKLVVRPVPCDKFPLVRKPVKFQRGTNPQIPQDNSKTALSSAPCWGRCFWAQSQLLIGMHQKSQFFSSEGMKLALLTRLRCHWPRVHCLLDRPFLKSPRTLCPRESLPAFGLGEPFSSVRRVGLGPL